MIKKTGAIDVYFEDEIQILVKNREHYSVSDLEATLTELEVEYTEVVGGGAL